MERLGKESLCVWGGGLTESAQSVLISFSCCSPVGITLFGDREYPKAGQERRTGDESEGDGVDATSTTAISSWGGLWTLGGADVHLEADRLLEDGGATAGLVFGPEAGL